MATSGDIRLWKFGDLSRASMQDPRCRLPTTGAKLLNHLIRLDQHVLGYHDADLLRGLQIDEYLEF